MIKCRHRLSHGTDGRTDISLIAIPRWCIKLCDITSLESVKVVGFFDVAARLCAGDGPIAALVGDSGVGLMTVNAACDRRLRFEAIDRSLSPIDRLKGSGEIGLLIA